jgi:hypothetical protein
VRRAKFPLPLPQLLPNPRASTAASAGNGCCSSGAAGAARSCAPVRLDRHVVRFHTCLSFPFDFGRSHGVVEVIAAGGWLIAAQLCHAKRGGASRVTVMPSHPLVGVRSSPAQGPPLGTKHPKPLHWCLYSRAPPPVTRSGHLNSWHKDWTREQHRAVPGGVAGGKYS